MALCRLHKFFHIQQHVEVVKVHHYCFIYPLNRNPRKQTCSHTPYDRQEYSVVVVDNSKLKHAEVPLFLSGFYIYIEASNPRQENDTAVMVLPPLHINGPLCLSFYYHMYGDHMGSLAVLGRWSGNVREIWNKTGMKQAFLITVKVQCKVQCRVPQTELV